MTNLSKNVSDFTFFDKNIAASQPTVAISACLNGQAVRYDAKDKSLITRTLLSNHLTLLNQCPEVGAGMSIPRPAIQLVQINGNLHALERDNSSVDVTDLLLKQRQKSLLDIQQHRICGYVFKSKSPSCGVGSTPIFDSQGQQLMIKNGLHAEYFLEKMPWIVLKDEKQLQTQLQCEHFIFLCLLINDLQKSIEKNLLSEFNTHYQFIFKHMKKSNSKIFLGAKVNLDNQSIKQYRVTFKIELEKFLLENDLQDILLMQPIK